MTNVFVSNPKDDDNNSSAVKEEKTTAQIIIDIKKHDKKENLLNIPETLLKTDKLTYRANEIKLKENEYRLTVSFNDQVVISGIDFMNNEDGYRPSCTIDVLDKKILEFEYINVSFTIALKVSKETLNGKGPKTERLQPNEYSASMETSKKSYDEVRVIDNTKFTKDTIHILTKNKNIQTLKKLVEEIKQKKSDYNSEIKLDKYQHIFCKINDADHTIKQIIPLTAQICDTKLEYFFTEIIYPEKTDSNDKAIAYIRCLIVTEDNKYPYLLPIRFDSQIVQIFTRIRGIVEKYQINHKNDIEFLCIKLCFINYQIQLNENDDKSTLEQVAQSILYPYSNLEDCEDLYLKVELILK